MALHHQVAHHHHNQDQLYTQLTLHHQVAHHHRNQDQLYTTQMVLHYLVFHHRHNQDYPGKDRRDLECNRYLDRLHHQSCLLPLFDSQHLRIERLNRCQRLKL